MSSVNLVVILGNVGKDPEVRYTNSGDAVANLSVATSEKWKDKKTGQAQEKTEWHRISAFGKTAEIIGNYVKKGDQIHIQGKIQTRKWKDNNGQDRFTTEIIANNVTLISNRNQTQQQPQQPQQRYEASLPPHMQQQPSQQQQYQQPMQQPMHQQPMQQDMNDNIPF